MKVQNMTSNRTGREVPNQFIIEDDDGNAYFQSYRTIIAKRENFTPDKRDRQVYLDENWDYSKTTGKYRNQFLGETRKETEAKIKDGTYIVTNLN
uniref:DUF8033 domain-containing protein n=1 Tax=viral metagenome TaxID=1070528 RepID=A0A6M3KW01_9ZZZZ